MGDMSVCDVVIPCRDEAAALPAVLGQIPSGWRVIVVDNGSTDATAEIARSLGAHVVHESQPGYGAAVHAGMLAADADFVAVMDGDDSMQMTDLQPMLQVVRSGGASMAIGRRRPVERGAWPWHARAGTMLLATLIRRRSTIAIHDLAPMRVCRRQELLDLDIRDRRFGYPLELMLKASSAGWTVVEFDVEYRRRAVGTKSKVSGSLRGTTEVARDFISVLTASS